MAGPRALCRRIGAVLIVALGLPHAAPAADRATPAASGTASADRVDAELLRDLEVLASPDYARDREVAGRVRVLERLRLLEMLRLFEGHPAQAAPAQPVSPALREVR